MHYAIFDSTGNLVESFEDEPSARESLKRIVDSEPETTDHVALFICGDDGAPIGNPIFTRAVSSVR
jgi:hypothetical protein